MWTLCRALPWFVHLLVNCNCRCCCVTQTTSCHQLFSSASLGLRKTTHRHVYILQNPTPSLHIACQLQLQVLLSDTDHIITPALSSSAFPSLSEASQRQMPAGTSSSNGSEQQHPLRPYWEYLSFLFKRQPEPDPDQMLELSYRDYLQVFPKQLCRGQ